MKNNKIFVLIFFLLFTNLNAAEFTIKSFKHIPNDISARKYAKKDINNNYCAIIKIRTDIDGLNFSSDQLEDLSMKESEYWLYVQEGTKYLEIYKNGFVKKVYNIPQRIKSSNVYSMILTAEGQYSRADANLIELVFKFNVDNVFMKRMGLAPTEANGKTAVLNLPSGNYNFKFSKEGYKDSEKTINLNKNETINVSLVKGKSETEYKLPGIVTINSEPTGADIFINDEKKGKTPFNQQMLAGKYKMTIRKKFYYSETREFTLNEGESKELSTIKLKGKFAYLTITATPKNSNIFIDEKPKGTQVNKLKLESGNYKIKIEKELYHSQEENIFLNDGENKTINFQLKPTFGKLEINSEPSGAKLFIDNEFIGETPYIQDTVISRKYDIKLEKDLYYSTEKEIVINDGELTSKTIILSKNYGTLNILAEKSDIFIDGKIVGNNTVESNLKSGNHSIIAKRAKHYDAKKEVFVNIGDNKTIELKPKPKMASMSIISEPASSQGAKIYVNDEFKYKTTPSVLPILIGDYDISLKHPRYLDISKNISLKEGDNKELRFQMMTYKGSIKQEYDKWNKRTKIGLWATGVSAVLGVVSNYSGDYFYDGYQNSTNTTDTDNYKFFTDAAFVSRDATYGISVSALGYLTYSFIRRSIYKTKMGKKD
ncbi:MAG: PEGA domain-containing protein [Candidatus Marinimicrobia bacterium]|jgi:hypothetical protein|nr:PEGA domain-containing protein [Candidatus Neomarinimicrobiota bacterium]